MSATMPTVTTTTGAAAAAAASAADKLFAVSWGMSMAPREYRVAIAQWIDAKCMHLGGCGGGDTAALLVVDALVGVVLVVLIGVIFAKGCRALLQLGDRVLVTAFLAGLLLAACRTLGAILTEHQVSVKALAVYLLHGGLWMVADGPEAARDGS